MAGELHYSTALGREAKIKVENEHVWRQKNTGQFGEVRRAT